MAIPVIDMGLPTTPYLSVEVVVMTVTTGQVISGETTRVLRQDPMAGAGQHSGLWTGPNHAMILVQAPPILTTAIASSTAR
jgi:hypothetical protein